MRRSIALLAVLALAGCGTAKSAGSGPSPPHYSGFPSPLPAGTNLAFAERATGIAPVVAHAALRSSTVALAVDRSHVAYVSCSLGAPLHRVGSVPIGTDDRFSTLMQNAHLEQIRSDPPGPGRYMWFAYGGHLVGLDLARHVHSAPCRGTECTAMLRMDPALRAVLPASSALTAFIFTHCPMAP
jgi:hypothetical protein